MRKTRNLLGPCTLLLFVCAISLDAVAQSFVIDEENYGLMISSPTGKVVSPELVSGLKCTLTNGTSKDIVSYAIVWTAVTASGQSIRSGAIDRASLHPGDSIDIDKRGSLTMGSSLTIQSFQLESVWTTSCLMTGPRRERIR